MFNKLLTLIIRRRKPNAKNKEAEALMNYALELAQEWGEEWLQPIQQRLGKAYPHLTQQELDKYNDLAQKVMKYSHNLVYSMSEKEGKNINKEKWRKYILSYYPWVNEENLSHLFSTGFYYAWKDGLQ